MKRLKDVVSHHEREVAELHADRELAVEYLKAAMAALDDPDDRAGGLLALRTVAEAYGGLGAVAADVNAGQEPLLFAGEVAVLMRASWRSSSLNAVSVMERLGATRMVRVRCSLPTSTRNPRIGVPTLHREQPPREPRSPID